MFGSDNNQQQSSVPTGAPINNDEIMQNDGLDPNGSIPSAQPVSDTTASHIDPSSVFPPSDSSDPFGTAIATPADDSNGPTGVVQNTAATHPSSAGDSELLDIKQQALKHLSPLVKHLDQSAEEKFKTTMMMIQASDDKSLVPTAFEAAKQIEDDKVRAQALLDIINEINYFTQQ